MHLQILLLLLSTSSSYAALGGHVGSVQSAAVEGNLTCNGKPAANVLIKLYDVDRGWFDTDDLLAKGKTDANGHFHLAGHTREITKIDPKVNIYHDCNDGWWPCQRKISVELPDSYVTDGEEPKKVYDVGMIELAGKFKGETRDCFH